METKIVCAFPGTGKSFATKLFHRQGYYVLDSDSSGFDKSGFPSNYINHIKENIGKVDIIFVSSHQSVRDALLENFDRIYMFYPDVSLREDYMDRYHNRGDSWSFINLIYNNWETWINDFKVYELNTKVTIRKLMRAEYLYDFLHTLLPKKENSQRDILNSRGFEGLGIYQVYWTSEMGGSYSYASIYQDESGDLFIAPANWIGPSLINNDILYQIAQLIPIRIKKMKKQYKRIKPGDTRIITKFLFFPLTLGEETRWLELVRIKQVFISVWDGTYWEDEEFV